MEFSKFTLAYQQARIMLSSSDEFVNNFFQSTVRQKESCQPPKRFIIQRFQALSRTRFRAPALAATRIYYQIIGTVSTGILIIVEGVRRQQKRSPKAQAFAGSRSGRPGAGGQPNSRSGQPRRRRPPAAEAFAQAAGGRRQVRKSTFRPNRTPRSPVSSLWAGGQRRAGCGICENAFSAPRRFRDSSRKGYMIRFLFPGPA